MSFDQSLRDVTKSLTDLTNATPNEFISQEMVDQAKKRLADLRNATPNIVKCLIAATSSK